jgi:hypothetical protein
MSEWQQQGYDPRQQQQPAVPPQWAGRRPQYPAQQQPGFPPAYQGQPQPPYGYYPPPVQVNVIQNAHGPRVAVTQGKLGLIEELFHCMMIVCTCGLWLPVYLSRKRSKRSVTTFR